MNKKSLLGFLILITTICCNQELSTEEILTQVNSSVKRIQIIEYNVDYKIKYFTSEDTTRLKGICLMEKIPDDTLLGFKTRIKQERGVEHIYTQDDLFVFNHLTKKVIIDKPKKNGVGPITGNVVEDLIFDELLNGFDLLQLKTDSVSFGQVDDKESQSHWIIEMTYPDQEDFTGSVRRIWINKETFLPDKMTFRAKWQDMTQYDELVVSKIKTNQTSTSHQITDINIPDDYKIEYSEPPSKDHYKTVENGIIPPDFELADLNGKVYKLSELKGKIVLLDFWYMSCYPCVKALPHIEEIYTKYENQGLMVFGINSHDNPERKQRLPDFLAKRDITYPTLLATDAIDSSYNVKAYPTLYLLDKEGKIIFSQLGFGDTTKDTLEQIIIAHIN